MIEQGLGPLLGCPDCGSVLGEFHKAGCPRSDNGKPTPTAVTAVSPGPFELLADLRRAGWRVGAHNDYELKGVFCTFWLFTHKSGVFAKGEGVTDLEAIREAIQDIKRRGINKKV